MLIYYFIVIYIKYQPQLQNKKEMKGKGNVMDEVVNKIFQKIAKIYDAYARDQAIRNDQLRQKTGTQIDKQEQKAMEQIKGINRKLIQIIALLEHQPAMKKPKLVKYPGVLKLCLQDIEFIVKKKSLLYKVNQSLNGLIKDTKTQLKDIQDNIPQSRQTKFCCFGIDGQQKMASILQPFKQTAKQWRLLALLEPKDSIQTFICPKFSSREYQFIRQIIRQNWPKQVPQTVRYIQVPVNTGKPSILAQANQYIYGINRQQNPSYGLKIYHEEAQKNDHAAACFLGQVYQQGLLLPRDLRKSMKFYQQAMNYKQPYANYRYAMSLIKGQNVSKQNLQNGFKILNQISSGDSISPQAMVQLGQFYQKGRFESDKIGIFTTQPDLKKAIDYYQRARSLQVPRASNNLGVLFVTNKNMSQNNPNAKDNSDHNTYANIQRGVKYLEQAESLGFPQAFYNLGCIYQSGIYSRKNLQQALMCYYKGGVKGDLQSKLKFAYQIMNQTSIMKQHFEDHYKIAYRWLDNIVHKVQLGQQNALASSRISYRHTSSQKAQALFYLGLMHQYCFGVDKNPKKAFNYYRMSSQLGYPAAINKIGDCYFSGFGTIPDKNTAKTYYLEAAGMNNSDALVNLGTIYLNGIQGIVQKNYNEAYRYFFAATKDQNSNAFIHLSYMYKKGLGLQKDRQMALKLLEQAVQNNNPTALFMLRQFKGDEDKVLFRNIDQQLFATPRKIDVSQIVPYVDHIPNNNNR